MDKEDAALAHLIDDSDHSEPLPKVLLLAGGAIGLILIVCIVLSSMSKTPSISNIEMPEKSSLIKPPEEVAGTNTHNAEVAGPKEPPKATPSTGSGSTIPSPTQTPTPTSASSPTSTPTPTSKPADPTPTTTPTPTPTSTPTPTNTPTPTPEPTITPNH